MIIAKETIDHIFEDEEEQEKPHQANLVVELYRLVFPNWDDIEKVNGFPRCGEVLNKYLFRKFIDFDQKHHPNVMNGGVWMNNGWSADEGMGDWEVEPCEVILSTDMVLNR